ncbi:MAG TPA: 50S ribosomal protein L32e [Candidatus Sulfotelmatobacter sp.]|nr:50S ribosomal protein L32e [Candidatus Sulfotelmatobacter sp.]
MPNNSKPAFVRQESWRYKRVKPAWRRARGVTSKMRKEEAGWPAKVKVGYGTAAATRGLHPRGLQERLINRMAELEGLDPKIHIIRISARVGERKRLGLLDEIRHRNFHIANPGKQEEKPVTSEEPAADKASGTKETQTPSKPIQAEEEAEETAEPDMMEDSSKDEDSEDEDK